MIYRSDIWFPYYEWEDYKNGMYIIRNDIVMINNSYNLLKNKCLFYDTALKMIKEWSISSHMNIECFTDNNKRAWIGQSSCCFAYGSTKTETCNAWWQLNDSEREIANSIADKVISTYKKQKENAKTLFD